MECDFCGSKKFGCATCNPNYVKQMAAIHIAISRGKKSTHSDRLPYILKEKMYNAGIARKDITYKKLKNSKNIYNIKIKMFKIKKQINICTDKKK